MDLDSNWFAALVTILAVFLAAFLILAIVLIVKIIQITKHVKRIIEQAEQVADKAEHIAAFFERTSTSMSFLKFIANITDIVSKKAKRK